MRVFGLLVFYNTPKNLSFWRPKFFHFYDEFFREFYSLNYAFLGSPLFWNGPQEFWFFTKFPWSIISQKWQDGPRDHFPAQVLFHGSVASTDCVRCLHYAVLLNFSAFTGTVGVEMGRWFTPVHLTAFLQRSQDLLWKLSGVSDMAEVNSSRCCGFWLGSERVNRPHLLQWWPQSPRKCPWAPFLLKFSFILPAPWSLKVDVWR